MQIFQITGQLQYPLLGGIFIWADWMGKHWRSFHIEYNLLVFVIS